MFYLSSSKIRKSSFHGDIHGDKFRTTTKYLAASMILTLLCAHSFALTSDAAQPIHIEGDSAEIDQHNETIVYTGSVEVVQGTLRVAGDSMVVKIKGDQVERIITLGSPARYSQQLEDDQGEVVAHADSIIYHTGQERIYLRGGASLQQLGNHLSGESIRYDIVKGKVDANSGDQPGRVRMEFSPQDTSIQKPAQ